jgi:hypothetical protein
MYGNVNVFVVVFIRKVSPYPSDDKMQSDLTDHVNWQTYKQALVDSIVSRRHPTNFVR